MIAIGSLRRSMKPETKDIFAGNSSQRVTDLEERERMKFRPQIGEMFVEPAAGTDGKATGLIIIEIKPG